MLRARLIAAADGLDDAQVTLLCEMADALGGSVDTWHNPSSDLMGGGFGDSLLNRLRLHHATSDEKFNKTSFEYAFKAASKFAGRDAVKTETHTYQGADVVVDGIRWSLKTEGAKNMSRTKITISKFSEARWIRDCVNQADFAREATSRIGRHLREYDRVLTLRGSYVNNREGAMYELVEIPHELLNAATALTASDFSPRTRAGGSSARVSYRGLPAFTVALDGSVEKVTLRNIEMSQCISHARWTVPILPQDN